jgi:hypothetical protein
MSSIFKMKRHAAFSKLLLVASIIFLPFIARARLGETFQQISNRLGTVKWLPDVEGSLPGAVTHKFEKDHMLYAVTIWRGKSVHEMYLTTETFDGATIDAFLDKNKLSGKWVEVPSKVAPEFKGISGPAKTVWFWNPQASANANEDNIFLYHCLHDKVSTYVAYANDNEVQMFLFEYMQKAGHEAVKKKTDGF